MSTTYGTFEELLADSPGELKDIATALRELVLEVHPGAVEVVRPGDRAATYGLGPKKMSEGYVYIMPQKSWVNLGFYRGASLPDPASLLEGTGKQLRHVKVRKAKEAGTLALKDLLTSALAERTKALGRARPGA